MLAYVGTGPQALSGSGPPYIKVSDMSENRQKTDSPKRKAPSTAFPKGVSGNPGGRPPKTEEQRTLEAMCRDKSVEALAVLENIMANGENERNRITAALAIIERGHGKAIQQTTLSGPDGGALNMNWQIEFVKPGNES